MRPKSIRINPSLYWSLRLLTLVQPDYKSNLWQRNQVVLCYVLSLSSDFCIEAGRKYALCLGLLKWKQFSSNIQRIHCVIYDCAVYGMCMFMCVTVSPVNAFNQRENYKETGDSQQSSWHLEVIFTQRGVLMKLKWEDWDFQRGVGIGFSVIL